MRSRRSESHCHPPREVTKGGMGGLAMRAITAYLAWPLHADDWRSGGWCGCEGAVETFMLWNPCRRPSTTRTTTRVENKIESDHAGGGRMARIGMGTTITPASRLHQASCKVDVRKRGGKRAQASQPTSKSPTSCEPELRAGAGLSTLR